MNLSLVESQQTIIGLNQNAIDEWIEYREYKKKPLSPLALKKASNRLLHHSEQHQQLMVDRAIENDWRGLHDIDPPKATQTRQNSLEHDLGDTSWAR